MANRAFSDFIGYTPLYYKRLLNWCQITFVKSMSYVNMLVYFLDSENGLNWSTSMGMKIKQVVSNIELLHKK
ncbi:MAG: hypothetical protein OHK0056_31850 [Bacteriovoracaceae bacterium]